VDAGERPAPARGRHHLDGRNHATTFDPAGCTFEDAFDDEQRHSSDETLCVWMADLYLWRLF
jgi:hypothetical protein